jgi:uncharacterized membrane protein YdjX (TVP38/TMEM64 family)
VGVLLVLIAAVWLLLPLADWVRSLSMWLRGLGARGIVLFAAFYIVAVVLLAPAEILTITAGLVYGFWAYPIVVGSATIGAALAFLVSRYLVRDAVKAWAESHPVWKAIDDVVKEEGWKIVGLVRLNPLVPFNLQNYFFGATEIGFLPYTLATFFGIMPGAGLYVYIGTLGQAAAERHETGYAKWAFTLLGLAATLAVVVVVGRKARAKLERAGVKDRA